MSIFILDCNFDKAKEIGNKLFTNVRYNRNFQNNMLENTAEYDFFTEQISVK